MIKKLHKLHREQFLVTGCEYLYDPRLSLADKGLLTTILTITNDSSIDFHVISTLNYESKRAYKKCWNNLIAAGYLTETNADIVVSDYVSERFV